jgi:hypothetical protein
VWTRRGLQRFFVLFFIELSTRKVHCGIAAAAPGLWMSQTGRNRSDANDCPEPETMSGPRSH